MGFCLELQVCGDITNHRVGNVYHYLELSDLRYFLDTGISVPS